MTQAMTPAGGDFNIIPYVSRPFRQSHPARLAALAAIFGLPAPELARCRVLELGCAAGGNLIPLAARWPEARFHGIDLTERHVADGRRRIAALGLDNITIQQGDIADASLDGAPYDFILCHGVYSWVPERVRQGILDICATRLADNGVAYVSYNVLPGWHMRNVIREMMLLHAGTSGEPGPRIARARWVVENIAKTAAHGTPFGEMLRGEAQLLARCDDSYIFGEFLVENNDPCYFRDFLAKAEASGLTYLCESELHQCLPENISPDTGALIRTMAAGQLGLIEQYMDFFKARTFRQSLLVKAAQGARIQRNLTPERMRALHVSGNLSYSYNAGAAQPHVFKSALGQIATASDIVRIALQGLAAAYPETRTVDELAAEVRSAVPSAPPPEALILDAVFQMLVAGIVEPQSVATRISRANEPKPTAWSLARHDAGQGATWTTNLLHEPINLDVVMQLLLPLLDGTRDRAALRDAVLQAVRDGRLTLSDTRTGLPIRDEHRAETEVDLLVRSTLDKMASSALFG